MEYYYYYYYTITTPLLRHDDGRRRKERERERRERHGFSLGQMIEGEPVIDDRDRKQKISSSISLSPPHPSTAGLKYQNSSLLVHK
jgi:hypothetical protein